MPSSLEYPRPDEVALDRELGRELMRARMAAGLSRAVLGEGVGLGEHIVAAAEEGSIPLSATRILRLLERTGTDPLTTFAHALAATTALDQPTPESVLLLTNHNRLPQQVRERVRDLVVSVAARA